MAPLIPFRPRQPPSTPAQRLSARLGWAAIAAAVLIAAGVGGAYLHFGVAAASAWQASARPWLLAWRLLLFAVLIGGWPWWTDLVGAYCRLDGGQRQFLLSLRWRLAAYLLAFEVLFNAADLLRL